jgi:hypothetical protein
MALNNFWDRRNNIQSKPSVTIRTERIIAEVMEDYEVSIGIAIEMLMKSETLYIDILNELGEYDKTILYVDNG